jgi:hypothetical protein
MRLIFTLFSFLLLCSAANAQKITGIWRGYFSSSNGVYRDGAREEMYKYEIQIEQQPNNGLTGVTYSYKSTVFYGKAQLQGIVTLPSKTLIIKEIKLLDLKIGDKSEPCLMTCYLDYTKMGKLEVLEGTFISINIKDKGDCGSGKVYLERVASSDFKKEDFLIRKKPDTSKNALAAKPKLPVPDHSKPVVKPPVVIPNTKDNLVTKNPPVKPQQKPTVLNPPATRKTDKNTVAKTNPKKDDKSKTVTPAERIPEEPVNTKKEENVSPPPTENIQRNNVPIPRVLVERKNNLVRTITTSEENIQIDLWDNGTIDNDTISVYHNNQLVISNGRLSDKAITVKIKCSKTDSRHEIIVVAENLGEIPPNTALMVITAGRERYEVFLASNEQRNAKVIINYVPKE